MNYDKYQFVLDWDELNRTWFLSAGMVKNASSTKNPPLDCVCCMRKLCDLAKPVAVLL